MENKSEPIRIAHIIGKWVGGGVEAVVMNYYRNIDRNKIQFDFICDEDSTCIPYDEIQALGGKVILIPPYQKVFKYSKTLKKVLIEGNYKIVHSHINTLSVFPLRVAKKAKIPVRIAHSHSTTNKKEWKKNLLKQVLRPFSKVYATDYMCCSEYAGRWLFGDKLYDDGKVYLLNNAIDIDKFKYDEKTRKVIRKELGINENDFVIGHVGRFVEQKNHRFLLDVFKKISDENQDVKLLLVGQGPLVEEMQDKVNKMKITDKVFFIGQVENTSNFYQAMDMFILPSIYEGLGLVVIEAQASGLKCICSTKVPEKAKLTTDVDFISLSEGVQKWKEYILKLMSKCLNRPNNEKRIVEAEYEIERESKKLEKIYCDLYYR